MPIIDFKEIPEAHIATGNQDSFELFCQEFLKFCGLQIVSVPDRGADEGKDLLCVEKRQGGFSTTEIRWLVSCKHKAHSGLSVTPADEENISDRILQHKVHGFIGFYSTVVSSGLNTRLNNYKERYEIKIFNNEEIEEKLLSSPKGQALFKRFFPVSYKKWYTGRLAPANIFNEYEPLICSYCGKDILNNMNIEQSGSLIGMVTDVNFCKANNYTKEKCVDVYFACKGVCDQMMEDKYRKQGYTSGWEDISDLIIPTEYIRWNMALFNNIYEGDIIFETVAFEKIKKALISMAQYVMREPDNDEKLRLKILSSLPEWL